MILKRVSDLEKLTTLIPVLAKENSQSAWNEFVQITSSDLHRYICYLLHDAEHASDILQEVYILFLRDKEIFVKICLQESEEIAAKKIYAWLYKTARNKSFDLIKKKKNGIAVNALLSQQAPSREPNMPTNYLEKKETNELIKYELSLLNEKQQNLLTLKYFHEKSNLEIAREINCEVISVPKLIDRALAQLKKRLEKIGFIISIAVIGESLSNKVMCIDMPAYLLPEVFQLYQTAPMGGLLTKPITIKGILMKSLYTIVGATLISTLFFYLNTPTQEQKKIETPKKVSITKDNTKDRKIESTKPIATTKAETITEATNNAKIETPLETVLTYQLENPGMTFKINSIPQLIEDYKKSPYFQFANSSATGSDFSKINFSKIYDMYNDILNLQFDSSDFEMLFSKMKNAKSFEYQSDLKKSFTLKLEFSTEEEAIKILEEIKIWLINRIEECKKHYGKSNEKIILDHEVYYKTKVEKIENSIYVFNGAIQTPEQNAPKEFSNNISIIVIINDVIKENNIIKKIIEVFNVDETKPILINYELNSYGLSEKIEYTILDEDKVYFKTLKPTEEIKAFLKSQNPQNYFLTYIKPIYLNSLIKFIASNTIENFDQKQMVLNLLCFQKFKKSLESLINESFNGEIIITSDIKSTQFLIGLNKGNQLDSLLETLKKDFSLPFEWQIIESKYIKITCEPLIDGDHNTSTKTLSLNEMGLCLLGSINTKAVFGGIIKERLLLAQKYVNLDECVKNCIPLLTNEQIYTQFESPKIVLKKENKNAELTINSAIPYFFGYLFFKDMAWDGFFISNFDSINKKDDIRNEPEQREFVINAVDNTLFAKETIIVKPYEQIELLYYNEKGQIEISYKGDKSKKIFEKIVFDKNNKIKESCALLEFQGKKNGEYKLFDTNGEPSIIGNYQAGIKSDVWRTYSGNELLSEINYTRGVPVKSFEKKFPGGGIETKVELDSIGNGNAKVYFKNGFVKLEGEFSNYKRVKCWKSFDQNGKLTTEIYYNLFGEKQKIITYYANQAKHFEVPFNGKWIDGKVTEFYLDGKLKGEYQIEKGIPTPKWISYCPESKIIGEWNTDNSQTGIFKAQNIEEGVELSFRIGTTLFLSFSALNIEAKLNLLYGRVTDEITTSINGPTVSNIPEIRPHLNLKGKEKSDIILYYGMIADKNQIKDSVQYHLNSWNSQFTEFIESSSSDSQFIMNDHIIYKFNFENKIVKSSEFLEFEIELF